ncbi:hypothetical protein MAPG_08688 [Magnaporthiopsis poae ATCC 64411]|uniref:Uncharacterized protein n=1 Tax=Magnaporthiopsis poae (strain ATCC 64411 / 73-15) TaxID=644358 RepID=A0A0C4E803_MAGP6|nr:hypothetical protein MAPG_08688 [Magnaporthiopsis poae ATCC 64411]
MRWTCVLDPLDWPLDDHTACGLASWSWYGLRSGVKGVSAPGLLCLMARDDYYPMAWTGTCLPRGRSSLSLSSQALSYVPQGTRAPTSRMGSLVGGFFFFFFFWATPLPALSFHLQAPPCVTQARRTGEGSSIGSQCLRDPCRPWAKETTPRDIWPGSEGIRSPPRDVARFGGETRARPIGLAAILFLFRDVSMAARHAHTRKTQKLNMALFAIRRSRPVVLWPAPLPLFWFY